MISGTISPFVGIDAFCNNVLSLEKQRAFLGDQGLDLSRLGLLLNTIVSSSPVGNQ